MASLEESPRPVLHDGRRLVIRRRRPVRLRSIWWTLAKEDVVLALGLGGAPAGLARAVQRAGLAVGLLYGVASLVAAATQPGDPAVDIWAGVSDLRAAQLGAAGLAAGAVVAALSAELRDGSAVLLRTRPLPLPVVVASRLLAVVAAVTLVCAPAVILPAAYRLAATGDAGASATSLARGLLFAVVLAAVLVAAASALATLVPGPGAALAVIAVFLVVGSAVRAALRQAGHDALAVDLITPFGVPEVLARGWRDTDAPAVLAGLAVLGALVAIGVHLPVRAMTRARP